MLKNSLWPARGIVCLAVGLGVFVSQGMAGMASGQTIGGAPSAGVKDAARRLMESAQGSVVTIVAPVRGLPGAPGKSIEAMGTVVTADGLTVTSNAVLDPRRVSGGGTEFAYLEMVMSNGATVPVEIVYRDATLDLVFLKPDARLSRQRGAYFQPVTLAGSRPLAVMDDVLVISRLDKAAGRAASVSLGNVSAVMRGAQPGYQTSAAVAGAPVFTVDGQLVGVTVHRVVDGQAGAPMTVTAQTVGTVVEIASATEYLASSSGGLGGSDLMSGLTLTVPSSVTVSSDVPLAPTAAVTGPVPGYSPAPTTAVGGVSAGTVAPQGAATAGVPAPAAPAAAPAADAPVEEKKGFFGFLKFGKKKDEAAAPVDGMEVAEAIGVQPVGGAGNGSIAPGAVPGTPAPPVYTEADVVPTAGSAAVDAPVEEKRGLFGFLKFGKKKEAAPAVPPAPAPVVNDQAAVQPIPGQAPLLPSQTATTGVEQLTASEQAFLQQAGIEGVSVAPVTPAPAPATTAGTAGTPPGATMGLPGAPATGGAATGVTPAAPGPAAPAAAGEGESEGEDGMVPLKMMKRVPKGKPKIEVLF
ncbi:MAG: serine protease [Verrucomicrobiota bacterium]